MMYDALEMILRARTGSLIVVGDTQEVLDLVNGGFKIDAEMHSVGLVRAGENGRRHHFELRRRAGFCTPTRI